MKLKNVGSNIQSANKEHSSQSINANAVKLFNEDKQTQDISANIKQQINQPHIISKIQAIAAIPFNSGKIRNTVELLFDEKILTPELVRQIGVQECATGIKEILSGVDSFYKTIKFGSLCSTLNKLSMYTATSQKS